jgi:hypothetical protein
MTEKKNKGNSKSVYSGTVLEVKASTEKAMRARIKWGNCITESWIPKKAITDLTDGAIKLRGWFVEKGSLQEGAIRV